MSMLVRLQFQLLHDQLVELDARIASGDMKRILNCLVTGTAVADDTDAVNAENRCASVGAISVAVDQSLQRSLSLSLFLSKRVGELLAGHLDQEIEDAFAYLEDHVADEPIGDDDVASALID